MAKLKNNIIVLHKSGANSHYKALELLAGKVGYKITYREFSVLSRMFKSIVKLDSRLFIKQWKNLFTLLQLLFATNAKVVLGIAPYDKTLLRLLNVLSGHQIYYHTSWPIWDGSYFPKKKGVNHKVKKEWKTFLEERVKLVFTVTKTAKENLESNYNLKQEPAVVGHAFYNTNFFKARNSNPSDAISFCYVGRLVEQKGVMELLEFFKRKNEVTFTIIGNGKLENEVKSFVNKYDHINYLPTTHDRSVLNSLFNTSDYLVLNSKRTAKWQELFGMVIIEAMAAGCIPIATAHIGPNEIISDQNDGFLFQEENFIKNLSRFLDQKPSQEMMDNAIKKAANYEINQVAKNWKAILKD
ncbi:glycosyltransferase involved in cell wall biosynthesis [Nonlabens dokdonensis]|uniref:Glycosyltransferase involved in cell wall biosynthesis n=2 Tax=Nonlabens dokdonensis TaxID=328515 RepID=A0ABX5Q025_9FLAO|nr:glycosyltransferase family 4 protein [Nonlabens dokdonensis]AGC75515.1 putative glycosyl transferase family 1 [Nonlabens dokdonensis DSW-6]PZX43211.1 glycosyltransferase involved in cell wall biosynthesis [Nonlabens dokdonensis]